MPEPRSALTRRERKWRLGVIEIEMALPPRGMASRWRCHLSVAIVKRRGWIERDARKYGVRTSPTEGDGK